MKTERNRLTDFFLLSTTMGGDAASLRQRLRLILRQPKMLGTTLAAVLLVMALAAACAFGGAADSGEPAPEPLTLTPAEEQIYLELGQFREARLPLPASWEGRYVLQVGEEGFVLYERSNLEWALEEFDWMAEEDYRSWFGRLVTVEAYANDDLPNWLLHPLLSYEQPSHVEALGTNGDYTYFFRYPSDVQQDSDPERSANYRQLAEQIDQVLAAFAAEEELIGPNDWDLQPEPELSGERRAVYSRFRFNDMVLGWQWGRFPWTQYQVGDGAPQAVLAESNSEADLYQAELGSYMNAGSNFIRFSVPKDDNRRSLVTYMRTTDPYTLPGFGERVSRSASELLAAAGGELTESDAAPEDDFCDYDQVYSYQREDLFSYRINYYLLDNTITGIEMII